MTFGRGQVSNRVIDAATSCRVSCRVQVAAYPQYSFLHLEPRNRLHLRRNALFNRLTITVITGSSQT